MNKNLNVIDRPLPNGPRHVNPGWLRVLFGTNTRPGNGLEAQGYSAFGGT